MMNSFPRNVVLVSGSRYLTKREHGDIIDSWLVRAKPDIVIQGGAAGADTLAREWALRNSVHCAEVPAMWSKFGRSAGPRRNDAMLLLRPTVLLAFPTPSSKGTRHMIRRAREADDIEVHVVEMVEPEVKPEVGYRGV